MYDFWQFLHVVSAMAWVGGGLLFWIYSERLARRAPAEDVARTRGEFAQVMSPVFMAVSIGTLATGLVMAAAYVGWPLWIKIGLAGVAVSVLSGALITAPTDKAIARLISEPVVDRDRLASLQVRSRWVPRIEMIVLLVVVWAMVAKPT